MAQNDQDHSQCKYLGMDLWNCGHTDNSDSRCDCHVCVANLAQPITVTLTVGQAEALVQGSLPSIPTGNTEYDADFVAAQDVLGAALEEKARG